MLLALLQERRSKEPGYKAVRRQQQGPAVDIISGARASQETSSQTGLMDIPLPADRSHRAEEGAEPDAEDRGTRFIGDSEEPEEEEDEDDEDDEDDAADDDVDDADEEEYGIEDDEDTASVAYDQAPGPSPQTAEQPLEPQTELPSAPPRAQVRAAAQSRALAGWLLPRSRHLLQHCA